MISRFIEANGIRVHVREAGEGPLVLLCHGFPETSHAWRHQLSALAEAGYHAVAPDLRGYGLTDAPDEIERYTLIDLVGDMVGLVDALDAEKAVIVGNDWGATLAWQAALLRPDRFRAVIAFGVPMMGQPPLPPTQIFPQTEEALFYTLYFQQKGVAEAEFERDIPFTLRRILFAASGEAGPRRRHDGTPNPFAPNPFSMVSRANGLLAPLPEPETLPAWLTPGDLAACVEAFTGSGFRGGLNFYRNLDRNWHLQRAFAGLKVEVPALYMVGERDVGLSIPGMDSIIAAMPLLVPRLQDSIVLPGCGHWLPQERPEQASRAIIDFVRGLG